MHDLDMLFVPHATEVEHERRIGEVWRTDISFERDMVDLSSCCLHCPFTSFYLIREVDTWSRDLDLEVQQPLKGLLFAWHNIELFAVPPARRGLVYAPTPLFWQDLDTPRRSFVATPLCFSNFFG